MSKIITFSVEEEFAVELEKMVTESGYSNRSKFLRDASLHFAQSHRDDDLNSVDCSETTEGSLIIYYQHGVESKLTELRHAPTLSVSSYNHNCLARSHTCVDTMQVSGQVKVMRGVVETLNNTQGIDRVVYIAAPQREKGCC